MLYQYYTEEELVGITKRHRWLNQDYYKIHAIMATGVTNVDINEKYADDLPFFTRRT